MEVQKPRQWWLLVMISLIAATAWFLALSRLLFGVNIGPEPPPEWLLAMMWALFGVGFPLFFAFNRMVTVVDERRVQVTFTPLRWYRKELEVDRIRSCQPITYHPLKHFGGWGVRSRRGTRAVTMCGNRGVALIVDNADWLIGSARPEELCSAIRRAQGAGGR
ncbi:MAG: DUF6141 family protein [Spirochaetota bacterium]